MVRRRVEDDQNRPRRRSRPRPSSVTVPPLLPGRKVGDLTGYVFTWLTVLGPAPRCKRNRPRWVCKCRCGSERIVDQYYLRRGDSKSCGCWTRTVSRERRQLPPGECGRNQLLLKYRMTAKEFGRVWELSVDQFTLITSSECYFCGSPPSKIISNNGIKDPDSKARSSYRFNGIDRLDNDQGYTVENSVPCCWVCNKMKSAHSHTEFLEHVRKIVKRFP